MPVKARSATQAKAVYYAKFEQRVAPPPRGFDTWQSAADVLDRLSLQFRHEREEREAA